MKQCKCEHWEQCPICMPHRFDADGNRLPIPPTPLQACQAQIEALTAALFQAQEAAKALAKQPAAQWVGLTPADFDWLEQMLASKVSNDFVFADIVCAIEAKLKERNNG